MWLGYGRVMKTKIIKGWIDCDEYGVTVLTGKKEEDYGWVDGTPLAGEVYDEFNTGDKVFIRYFVTDKEVSLEQAEEALVFKTVGGQLETDYELDAYSEYTILELREELKVGGHDLFAELSEQTGKYLILVIEQVAQST